MISFRLKIITQFLCLCLIFLPCSIGKASSSTGSINIDMQSQILFFILLGRITLQITWYPDLHNSLLGYRNFGEYMTKNSSLILMSSLFGFASILFVWFGESSVVSILTREDGIIESLSAIFYMVAIIAGSVSIFKAERVYLPIIWTLLCFIFLGEETSWFQRFFLICRSLWNLKTAWKFLKRKI